MKTSALSVTLSQSGFGELLFQTIDHTDVLAGIVLLSITVVDLTQKHSFAGGVSGLGTQSEDIVRTARNGEEFHDVELPLDSYVSQLNTLTANHEAYPVLHYFYSERAEKAPVVAITILDEALTIFRFGIPERHRPNAVIVENARSSVQTYLETLHSAFIQPASRSPSSPDLDPLRDGGIPTVSDEEFTEALDALAERRRTLLGLVESDARRWPSRDDRP